MRKAVFVLFFIFFTLVFFYSGKSQSNVECGGYNANNCPSPDCKVILVSQSPSCTGPTPTCVRNEDEQTRGSRGQGNVFCYPSMPGLITQSAAQIDAAFNYDNFPVEWKINVDNSGASIVTPGLPNPIATGQGNENCKYYTFSFKRNAKTYRYNVPFVERRVDLDGVKCFYNIQPVLDDLGNVIASGGGAEICPDLRAGRPNPSEECSVGAECIVRIFEGPKKTFGYTYEKDDCGNKIVQVDNSGRALSTQQIIQNPTSFIRECSAKYQRQESACGNGRIDDGEECDGANLNGKTCQIVDNSYNGGTLRCNSECKFDKTECTKDIRAVVFVNVNTDVIDKDNNVKKQVYGKILSFLELKNANERELPQTVLWRINTQGDSAFLSMYSESLGKIAKDPNSQTIWNLLNRVKGTGIYGLGIIKTLKQDKVTIDRVFSGELSMINLLANENEDDWKNSEITIEIRKNADGSSSVRVSHQIFNTGKNKLLSDKRTTIQMSRQETEVLTKEIIRGFTSYKGNKNTGDVISENRIPVLDVNDEINKINSGTYTAGKGLKILHKYIFPIIDSDIYRNTNIQFEKIEVDDLFDYYKKLYPDESSGINEETEIALALSESSITA